MATLGEAIERAARRLADANVSESRAEARRLAALATGKAPEQLLSARHEALSADAERRFDGFVDRRAAHEPFAYIAGEREFWSLPFRVTPATLVPRPDTETVVEAALGYARERGMTSPALRIADLGTGSGALLLALLTELPTSTGVGTDRDPAALGVARDNGKRLGLDARSHWVGCDYAEALGGGFDIVVSNPPYVTRTDIADLAPEVREFDPHQSLDGGPDGLDGYRAIASGVERILVPGGALIVEFGAGQASSVSGLLAAAGLQVEDHARRDLAGIERVLTARRVP